MGSNNIGVVVYSVRLATQEKLKISKKMLVYK